MNDQIIKYQLTEEEIKTFLSSNYGINSKSGNKSIGKAIVEVINSFERKDLKSSRPFVRYPFGLTHFSFHIYFITHGNVIISLDN